MSNMKHIFVIILAFLSTHIGLGQNDPPIVMHLKVLTDIDPRTNRYIELGFEKAEELNVDYVIIELDTYGGALNDADEIRTRILNFKKPIYAFINKDAASAGALISIACDSIYMSAGSSIGAATVVTGQGEVAPDKYQSYMRSIMRSTAEARGRNPEIAEAMVDEDINLDSIAGPGKVLTFSVSEAITYGFCEAQVTSITEIMNRSGISNYQIEVFELDTIEQLIALFLNPFVSGLLILIIIGGIYFELQTPGIGFPIAASFVAALLYFTPYYLNGLAENWEVLLFIAGVLLLVLEIFVIPGFGLAGILGLIFIISALTLVMVDNDGLDFDLIEAPTIFKAFATTIAGIMGSLVVLVTLGIKMTATKFFDRVALKEVQSSSSGFTATSNSQLMIGKIGITASVLRPSGKILIDGDVYDAYTRSAFIEKGIAIVVISTEGTSLKVAPVTP